IRFGVEGRALMLRGVEELADAVKKAAVEEGIVPGGGVALLYASK
uniref:Chaperonin-60 LS2 fragment (Fragments) n=1 Tax=Brassica napus TaxID=3708 RepID=Q9T2T3_BRANA